MATTIIRPTSDNSIGNWTNSVPDTTDLYSYVDEETAVDTDYVQLINSGGGSSVLFGFEDVSLGKSPINSLKVYARISSSLNFVYTIALVTHSVEYHRVITAASGFNTYSVEWALNPYTGLPWTETEINDVVIGIYAHNTNTKSATAKVSQIYAEVLSGSTNLVPIISVPGTMADDATVGTAAWSNPNNAKVDDNSYTNVTLSDTDVISHYLKASNFGFSIPAGATIDGIIVSIKQLNDLFSHNLTDSEVKIVKANGSIGSTNKAVGSTWIQFNRDYVNYGSSSDLWGESWTAEDINDADFGAVLSVITNDSAHAYIDAIRISIYYSETTAGPANLKSYNTNLKANIKTINTNAIANVKSLNTNV